MFKHAVAPELLLLIEILSERRELTDHFYLAGGTALALQLGHRRSDDLDFFSPTVWQPDSLEEIVLNLGGKILVSEDKTLPGLMAEFKLSFFYYLYKIVTPLVFYGNLRLASVLKIGCMKAVAISQGAEKKDFSDLMAILQSHRRASLKAMFLEKYGTAYLKIVLLCC